MISDELATLAAVVSAISSTVSAAAPALTAVAAGAGVGMGIYSLAQGTPKVPAVSMPEIPAIPAPAPGAPTPETPAAPADITQPLPTVKEVEQQTAQALSLKQRRGRAATILTGPSGFYSSPSPGALKTLLGA